MKKLVFAACLAAAGAGPALAQTEGPGLVPPHLLNLQHCEDCATVQEVRLEKRSGGASAAGMVAGAAAGGLLGHQIGSGSGKTLATVAGAVAGGVAGHEIGKRVAPREVWITRLRWRDGSERSFEHDAEPPWRPGETVRVKDHQITRF